MPNMGALESSAKKTHRLSDAAYADIRRAIVRCALVPGSFLTENGFIAGFGHTRASVRAALARLEADGLIKPERRIGYVIKPITLREAIEISEVGKILLAAAARMAAGRVDLARLEALDAQCRREFDPSNPASVESFLQADCDFHSAIAASSGNARLEVLSRNVLIEARRLFQFAWNGRKRSEKLSADHAELIEALATGDPDRAAAITERHAEAAKQFVMDALMSSTAVLDTRVGLATLQDTRVSSMARLPSAVMPGGSREPVVDAADERETPAPDMGGGAQGRPRER